MEKIQPATDLQLSLMKQFWAAYGEPPHVRPLNATLLKKDFLSLIARVEQGTGKLPITRVVDVEDRFTRAIEPAGVGVETGEDLRREMSEGYGCGSGGLTRDDVARAALKGGEQ